MVLKEPIPFSLYIPMVGGLSTKEPSEIQDTEFQAADLVQFDDGVAERSSGVSQLNAGNQLEGGAAVDGVWRSNSDEGVSRLLAVCNGKLYESSDWTTPIYTGLTAGKLCTFKNYRGKTIISTGYEAPIVYDPKSNKVIGKIVIQGPRQIKKIAYFETDETWTGGTADIEVHVYDELSGPSLQGRKLTATAGNQVDMSRGSLSLDLSQYDDSKGVDGWDYIDISTYHKVWKNVDWVLLRFETSPGNRYEFTFTKDALDVDEDGKSQERNNRWTHHKIRRNRFTATGAPNWNSITKIQVFLKATATGTAEVTFDNCRLRRTPPVEGPFRVDIATFEPSEETWTGGVLDVNNARPKGYSGACSRKLTNGDATTSASIALDLTGWPNGELTSLSDEVHLWAKINDSTKITDITLKLGDAALANRYQKTWNTFEAGTDLWNKLVCARSDFGSVGAPNWGAIEKVQIEATIAAGGVIYTDDCALMLKGDAKQISTVEKDTVTETWTNTVGKVRWNSQHSPVGDYSLRYELFPGNYEAEAQVVFDAGSEKDLTQWTDGTESTEDDLIAFWLYAPYFGYIISMEMTIDCNTGDFATDYFKKVFTPADLWWWQATGDPIFRVAKNGLERHGTSAGKGWDTVKGFKISFKYTHISGDYPTLHLWLDNLYMERSATDSYSGKFRWKTVFKYGELRSPPSEATEWLDLKHEIALLKKVPTSGDSRVTQREIYRQSYDDIGTEDLDTFYLAGTIFDNAATVWIDDVLEPGLSMREMGVPEGTFKDPTGVVVTEFKDQIILLQILDELKSIKYSSFANIYAWSDLSARDFPAEVVGGITHFDNFFVFGRDGHVHQVPDDIAEGGSAPLGQLVKAVSPWGICKVEEEIGVVTDKDIKLFSGYGSRSIGEAIENYLDPVTYKTEESLLFYHQKHLYYMVESRSSGRLLLECYVPSGAWNDRKLNVRSICAYDGRSDKGELVIGGTDGYLYQINTGYSTGTMKIRSKDYGLVEDERGNKGYLFHEKEIQECRIIARGKDSTSGSLTVKFYANGADTGISITIPASGHLNTRYTTYVISLAGITNAPIGQLIGVEVSHATASKSPLIKGILLTGQILPLEEEFTV